MKQLTLCLYFIGLSLFTFSQNRDSTSSSNMSPAHKWVRWPNYKFEFGVASNSNYMMVENKAAMVEGVKSNNQSNGVYLVIDYNVSHRWSIGLNYYTSMKQLISEKIIASYYYYTPWGMESTNVKDIFKVNTNLRYFSLLAGYELIKYNTASMTGKAGISYVRVIELADIKGNLFYPYDGPTTLNPTPTIIDEYGYYKQSRSGVNFTTTLEYANRLFRNLSFTLHATAGLGVIQPKMNGEMLEIKSASETKYYGMLPHKVSTSILGWGFGLKYLLVKSTDKP